MQKSIKPIFISIFVFCVLVLSALGGALADRLFVIKPLDYLAKRTGSDLISPQGGITTQVERQIVHDESIVVNVAEKASESVVTVAIEKEQAQSLRDPFLDPFGFFQQPFQTQPQELKHDIGSGFVVGEDGLIVTNRHVVNDRSATYKIVTKDNQEYKVEKIYRDPSNDIAILKISAKLKPMKLGDSGTLKVGQSVIAIGTALGEFRHTVTTGVISGLGRGIEAGDGFSGFAEQLDNVIQTDAAINPGNSGGPLINSAGEVIGVNTAVASMAQNVGFALPINLIKTSIDNFNSSGQFSRPFFGVAYQIIPSETALLNNVPEGAYVMQVVKGSSAEKAGIQPRDIIVSFAGVQVKDAKSGLAELINKHKVGDAVEVEIYRGKEKQKIQVTLQEEEMK
jgi:serine protease Do